MAEETGPDCGTTGFYGSTVWGPLIRELMQLNIQMVIKKQDMRHELD
jgi:hypothetical protein